MPTVLSFTEVFDGRHGTEDDFGRRQLVRVFRLQFDSINVGYSYVLYAQGMPVRFAAYEGPLEADAGCRAVRRSAVQDYNDAFWWTVTVEYDSISQNPALTQSGGGQGGSPTNEVPTLDPPDIQWGAAHDTITLQRSFDDPSKALCTSANEPYESLAKDLHRPSLVYSRNESEYDAEAYSQYWDLVNSATFAGFDPRVLKLSYTTGHKQYRNNTEYWRVTYFIEARYPDWDFHLADRGTRVFNDNNVAVPVTKKGIASGKVFLDGAGKELDELVLATSGPIILDFKAYDSFDFSVLGLTGL